MKKIILAAVALCAVTVVNSQDMKTIQLNAPEIKKGLQIMESFQARASAREFSDRKLSVQDLSNLLWAANGINRPDGKRTAPSAIDVRDIDIYVCMEDGAYLYNPAANILNPVAKGDFRELVEGSPLRESAAPLYLVLVSETARYRSGIAPEAIADMAKFNAGIVSQNIALFCAGMGFVTVPRMTMDKAKLKEALKLNDTQLLLLNNPVGHRKPRENR